MVKFPVLIGIVISVAAVIASSAAAQESAVVSPVYRRAQSLVNEGNPAAGRALIDSMISVAPQGTNEYAEAVYWRAVLAGTASDAEMDYRRILVDYPRSPRVEDALIRLAQLEIARANYDGALRHLNTLVTEHPQSPSRARASYWIARASFDKNDIQGGCTATADALARTSDNDTELRNQISYLNQRCSGVALTPQATTSGAASVATPTASPVTDSTVKVQTPPAVTPSTSAGAPTAGAGAAPETTAPATDTKRTGVKTQPKKAATGKSSVTTAKPAAKSPTETTGYSVQVAAYNVKSQAAAMAAKLRTRGYEARVDGEKAPFRVRIGRYSTSAQASAVQRSLKAKQITGFVVQADTQ
jgi:TolA-binding protein